MIKLTHKSRTPTAPSEIPSSEYESEPASSVFDIDGPHIDDGLGHSESEAASSEFEIDGLNIDDGLGHSTDHPPVSPPKLVKSARKPKISNDDKLKLASIADLFKGAGKLSVNAHDFSNDRTFILRLLLVEII